MTTYQIPEANAPYFYGQNVYQGGGNPSQAESGFYSHSYDDSQYGGKISRGNQGSYQPSYNPQGAYTEDEPLLQELGIDIDNVKENILFFLNPLNITNTKAYQMKTGDLSGPFLIICALGASMMLTGRVNFGYLYGISAIGCLSIWGILKLITEKDVQLYESVSVLGYGLTPLTILSILRIFVTFSGTFGFIFSVSFISWSTHATATQFVKTLQMEDQHFIIGYPIGLFFTCFAIMILF